MASFKKMGSLGDLQKFVAEVYAVPDDRLYSIWDLLTQEQRFAMRALKGIRKGEKEKLKLNLLIAVSWIMAIGNRLHIDLDEETWKRFPGLCSYCGKRPCECKKTKPTVRLHIKGDDRLRPRSFAETQSMFDEIYPSRTRTLADAGVHLAEEVGEVSEAIHNYLGQHKERQFDDVKMEIADFISCVLAVANSADINFADSLAEIYSDNCHVCHKAPCVCNFSDVVQLET
jgi:NTP pyrophosphatase (non-canonical NTP hydrolase)